MSNPPADQPAPFPSISTPTTTTSSADVSYEDIVRKTVPLPDSSHRTSPSERREAELPQPGVTASGGANAFPNHDAIRAAMDALGASGADVADVQVSVVAGKATIVGSVARSTDRDRIVTALGQVAGVVEVTDQLRIRLE